MRKDFGTLSWVERTGGKLAWYDKMGLIYEGVKERMALSKRTKKGEKFRYIEVDDILPPDSAITREAIALCEDVSKPYLVNHCLRSYFWARLITPASVKFDDEATFTGFMLHDLGITPAYQTEEHLGSCFTLSGARVAEELAVKHGWDDKRAALVANAITLHLNLTLDDSHGPEARMLMDGTSADVIGLYSETIHQDQIDAVVGKYPRLNQNEEIEKDFGTEAALRPCCRISFFYRTLGLKDLIKEGPFAE